MPTIIPSDKPIEKQVVEDMADAILSKLNRYELNCLSAQVIDYYDADIESKVEVGRKFGKLNKKVLDLSNDEYEKLPSCSWTKHLKNTANSVIAKNKSLIKLTHLVVATAVESRTYSEYGTFLKKLKVCVSIINHVLWVNRFVVNKSGKVYRMCFFPDQTYNNFVNEIVTETKDLPDGRP